MVAKLGAERVGAFDDRQGVSHSCQALALLSPSLPAALRRARMTEPDRPNTATAGTVYEHDVGGDQLRLPAPQ
jgi:hypothetical protein